MAEGNFSPLAEFLGGAGLWGATQQSAPDEERAVTIRLREKRLALSSLNAVQYAGRQQLGGLLFDKHFADVLPSPVNVRQTNG